MKTIKYLGSVILTILLIACVSKSENLLIHGNWIEVIPSNPSIVQGISIEKDGKANSIGMETLKYDGWKELNDTIILSATSIGTGISFEFTDTLQIVKLTADSLILRSINRDDHLIKYYKVNSVEDIKPFNVLDSLSNVSGGHNKIQTRVYDGSLAMESCIEVRNKIYFYNYEGVADGVYKLNSQYLRGEGQDPTSDEYGRYYVLKGSAKDQNAVVYQLVPFGMGETINFQYEGDKLVLLNENMEVFENQVKAPSVFLEQK